MPQIPGVADHAAPKPPLVKRIRKAITAACGLAVTVLAANILDDKTAALVSSLLAIATTYGVYVVPNAQPPA